MCCPFKLLLLWRSLEVRLLNQCSGRFVCVWTVLVLPWRASDTHEGLIKHRIPAVSFSSLRALLAICSPVKSLNFNAIFPAPWDHTVLPQGRSFSPSCTHNLSPRRDGRPVMHDSPAACYIEMLNYDQGGDHTHHLLMLSQWEQTQSFRSMFCWYLNVGWNKRDLFWGMISTQVLQRRSSRGLDKLKGKLKPFSK